MSNQLELNLEEDWEEAHYYSVLKDLCNYVVSYGSDKVLHDLEQVQRSLGIEHGH